MNAWAWVALGYGLAYVVLGLYAAVLGRRGRRHERSRS